jgi:DNA (cytosine-5)-methyltransferase 1
MDENGIDRFRFPDGMKDAAKFKQLGNSVSIPVVEAIANFVVKCIKQMSDSMGEFEKLTLNLDPDAVRVYRGIEERTRHCFNKPSKMHCVELLWKFGCDKLFSLKEAANATGLTNVGVGFLLRHLCEIGCLQKVRRGSYTLAPLLAGAPKIVFGPRFGEDSQRLAYYD